MSEEQESTVDLGADDAAEEQGINLEEKYQDQMRQIVIQKIELPVTTLPTMIREQITLNPEFQRRGRWDVERRSRFIESIIMNVPIPPVFLGEDEYSKYVVLDGRQRLTALFEFMRNTYELRGLKVWKELNGSNFADLEKKQLDRFLTRRFVPAVVVLKESSPQVKYDVFDRLNTGGVVAGQMEIRNAVFPGKFNRLLHELSESQDFRALWDIPGDSKGKEANYTYSTMLDLELVLRFFAIPHFDGGMKFKDFLSDYMQAKNAEYAKDDNALKRDVELFAKATKNCWRVFKQDAFKKITASGTIRYKSAPLADAVMFALSSVDPLQITDEVAERIREAFRALCVEDVQFQRSISAGTNGRGSIETRLSKVRDAIHSVL